MTLLYVIHAAILGGIAVAIARVLVDTSRLKRECEQMEAEINEAKS